MVVVPVRQILDGSSVLSGRLSGAAAWSRFQPLVMSAPTGSLIVFDFADITVVTPSYFLAGIWPAWETPLGETEIFPSVANLPVDSVDDIELVLRDKGTALWQVTLVDGEPREATRLGPLEDPLRLTLDLVVALEEATPSDLFERDRKIGLTAWSNRLNALYQHRLIRRRKEGRRMIYAATWKEHLDG